MAALGDPEGAGAVVRTVFAWRTPDGRIPSFSHWQAQGNEADLTLYRSFPPGTSMCMWEMHERRPDRAFLEEVYPALVRWHDWCPERRDGNHSGLLEWGSERPSLDKRIARNGPGRPPVRGNSERTMSILLDPGKFWLPHIVPTVPMDDPVWPEQHYGRGQIWPPSNYLVWLGVRL